jgi:hypothetical protein
VASAPAPQFDNTVDPLVDGAQPLVEDSAVPVEADAEALAPIPSFEYIGVVHLTRTWVQYGIVGFAVLCIVIGAVEALFGR